MSFHQLNKKLVDAFKYKSEVTSVCPECIRIIPGLIEEDEMGIEAEIRHLGVRK